MTELRQNSPAKDWLEAELADTLDEDYELEMSEPALSMEIAKIYKNAHPPSIDRMHHPAVRIDQAAVLGRLPQEEAGGDFRGP